MAIRKVDETHHSGRSCAPYYSDDPDPRFDVLPPHMNKNAVPVFDLLTEKSHLLPPAEERPDVRQVLRAIRVGELQTVVHAAIPLMLVGKSVSSWRSPVTWACMGLGAATGFGAVMFRTYLRLMGVGPEFGP